MSENLEKENKIKYTLFIDKEDYNQLVKNEKSLTYISMPNQIRIAIKEFLKKNKA